MECSLHLSIRAALLLLLLGRVLSTKRPLVQIVVVKLGFALVSPTHTSTS